MQCTYIYIVDDVSYILSEESCTSREKGWIFIRKTDEGDELWRKAERNVHSIDLVKVQHAHYIHVY